MDASASAASSLTVTPVKGVVNASASHYSEPAPSSASSVITGKRTYADAALSSVRPSSTALPVSLEGTGQPRRRRRRLSRPPLQSALSRNLWNRQLGYNTISSNAQFDKLRFSNMKLQASLDTHDADALLSKTVWLRNRSKVIEIVSSNDLIFSLTYNGLCTAFSRDLRKRICFMNASHDEVIRSVFLNKSNDSLITVSVFSKDDFSSLHCRSTPLAHIRKGYLKSSRPIFESEILHWPGFVEFDDVNNKILTFSAEDKKYKLWDLCTYNHLYTLEDERIHEIKISQGILLLIHDRQESHLPIRIHNIDTGEKLKEFNHLVHRKRKIDFIEQFHEKLLVKQEHENLQIVDVYTGHQVEVERTHLLTPNAFIFLYERDVFITFQQRQVNVWNFKGERVTDFEDHVLFRSDFSNSSISITQNQDIIVSYCLQEGECSHGTINLSWIDTGKLLGKVTCGPKHGIKHVRALDGVSALHFSEERNEIYSGSRNGVVHVWSN